jgi:hypothetical protein
MATMTPSRLAKLSQEPLDSASIVSALRPWRRRFALQQTLRWTLWGINAGLLLACIALLIARITPWSYATTWAISSAVVCMLIALALAFWKRPSLARTARLADSRLLLHDRLSTAWELREQSAPLVKLQRRDALKQLQKHRPAKTLSLRPGRSTALFCVVVAIFCIVLLVLPNPMTAILKQQAAFQARIAKQIASIEQVRQNLDKQTNVSPEEQQKIDQILQNLENKLQQAKTDTQAQQAIAQSQGQLNQLHDPQASNKAQANTAASSSLQNSKDPNLKALGNALASNDSQAVAKALQNLAEQLNKMTPEQRAQVSQQLENAANQASQDLALSSALHQTAKAVSDDNPGEVSDASKTLQATTKQNAATQAKENSINQASQSVQQVANTLASSNDGSTSQNPQGQSQNPGQQTQGQQGQQGGQQSQSQQGGGQQSQSQGQGQGQGQGQQGQGHGGSQGGNGAGNQQGKNEQVTIPGQTSSGSSTQSSDNNTSVVQSGSSVPYSQVIQQYSQMAHDEIDNSNVSPDQKDLVQNYFNHLEGQ